MKNSDVYAKRCSCGAITIQYTNDEGEQVNNEKNKNKALGVNNAIRTLSNEVTICNEAFKS